MLSDKDRIVAEMRWRYGQSGRQYNMPLTQEYARIKANILGGAYTRLTSAMLESHRQASHIDDFNTIRDMKLVDVDVRYR